MKVLVVSDSHGKAKLLKEIVKRAGADHVIHCGDFCTEEKDLPNVSLTVVRGNCDFERVPEEQIWETGRLRFYVTHGHKLQVKSTPLPIRYRAEEVGANIACFGHSHYPFCEQVGEILVMNPGSISSPRGFPYPTYACVEILHNQVRVTYYQTDGQMIRERGGSFPL